jgi:hypothetical protein
MNRSSYGSSSSSSGSGGVGGGGGGMGLGLLSDVETIRIEHIFTFNLNEKWERPFRKSMSQWLDICTDYAESFRFIAVGIGSYFFLLGISKVIAAGNYSPPPPPPRNHDGNGGIESSVAGTVAVRKSSKSSTTTSSDKKFSDNASVRSNRTTRSSKKTKSEQDQSSDVPIPNTITWAMEDINTGTNNGCLPETIPEIPSTGDAGEEG